MITIPYSARDAVIVSPTVAFALYKARDAIEYDEKAFDKWQAYHYANVRLQHFNMYATQEADIAFRTLVINWRQGK